jgi:solute carrier family 8 (sodium/calcium exchanger)
MFASMTAARTSKYADSAVGNVTGSNSVNVFLGLGLPWVISAQYMAGLNKVYEVPAGKLGFSVAMFLGTSLCCFVILTLRRIVSIDSFLFI